MGLESQSCWIALHDGHGVAVVAADSEEEARGIVAEHGLKVDRVLPAGETRLRPGVRISINPAVHAGTLPGVYPPGHLDEVRDEWR